MALGLVPNITKTGHPKFTFKADDVSKATTPLQSSLTKTTSGVPVVVH